MWECNIEVDATGLMCPLPLLRLKKTLAGMTSGEVVKLIATDPAAHLDLGVYVEQAGHVMLTVERLAASQVFYIKKH